MLQFLCNFFQTKFQVGFIATNNKNSVLPQIYIKFILSCVLSQEKITTYFSNTIFFNSRVQLFKIYTQNLVRYNEFVHLKNSEYENRANSGWYRRITAISPHL